MISAAATLTVNRGGSSADDHQRNHEPDGNGGSDGDVHGSCGRDGAARLPVAEERSEYRGSNVDELHDAGNRTKDSGTTFYVVVTEHAGR